MKKYLLTALLGVFGLFGFASAVQYSTVGNGNEYTPTSMDFSESFSEGYIGNVVYSCPSGDCTLSLEDNDSFDCSFNLVDGVVSTDCLGKVIHNTGNSNGINFYNYEDGTVFSSFGFDIVDSSWSFPAGGDSDSSGTFLPNGTDDLKPIINGLESTMAEFIPYVAYIGLGIIVAVLGFVAIRRLVNRVRAKIFDNF